MTSADASVLIGAVLGVTCSKGMCNFNHVTFFSNPISVINIVACYFYYKGSSVICTLGGYKGGKSQVFPSWLFTLQSE